MNLDRVRYAKAKEKLITYLITMSRIGLLFGSCLFENKYKA